MLRCAVAMRANTNMDDLVGESMCQAVARIPPKLREIDKLHSSGATSFNGLGSCGVDFVWRLTIVHRRTFHQRAHNLATEATDGIPLVNRDMPFGANCVLGGRDLHCAVVLEAWQHLQQINGTAPEHGFAGTFVGPGYTQGKPITGDAKAFCNLLISTGFGSQIYLSQPDISPSDPACTDLANYPISGYYLEGSEVKCTGPGEGYLFNYPGNITGAPATGYYCQLFMFDNNGTSFSMTFNAGSTADVQCPEEMADESDPTAGGTVGGYIEYYSLNGALLADC